MKEIIEQAIEVIDGVVDALDVAETFANVRQELQQLLDKPDNLTIAYMAGVERGKDIIRAEIEKEKNNAQR